MNLLWIAIIASFVLVEKVASAGNWVGRSAGLLLIGWGLWMAAGVLG
jgi:predicted metal-binding membrane protein